ncbi:MAG: hypothetical protein ACPGWR_00975 [Ardenticatenaceae bacterium]
MKEKAKERAEAKKPIILKPKVKVQGNNISFRTHFPVRECGDVLRFLREANTEKPETCIALMMVTIEEWSFNGSPQNMESYEDMDFFTEFWPVFRETIHYVNAIYGKAIDSPKSWDGAFSSD